MRISVFKTVVILGGLLLSGPFVELGMVEGLSLEELDLSESEITSFRVKYLMYAKSKEAESSDRGRVIFKAGKGYIEELFTANNEINEKTVENFIDDTRLTYDYTRHIVYKIDYKSFPLKEEGHPRFIAFSILDIFFPFRFTTLIDDSVKLESTEKTKDRDFDVITGIIFKNPFQGNNCKIWQDRNNRFIYRFIIYNKDGEAVYSLEITEVEINPQIEDADFRMDIPSDFKEIDITDKHKEKYRMLKTQQGMFALNYKLSRENEELKEKIEAYQKEKNALKEIEGMLVKNRDILEKNLPSNRTKMSSVLRVERDLKFIIVGLGKIDNLAIGDIFRVYRENELLGSVQITQLYDDMAVAEALTQGLIDKVKESDEVVGPVEVEREF